MVVFYQDHLLQGDLYARSSAFTSYQNMALLGTDVSHATLGIVGMGRIGTEVARRATGFKMNILYHNRNRREVLYARIVTCV